MWGKYYDSVKYKNNIGTDISGDIVYGDEQIISVRMVSGGHDFSVNKDNVTIEYTKEYQIPFMIKEGDLIDGRIVRSVEPSRDVFGNFHFCIAKVR